ncbi:hypothetical protein D3C71_2119550 [compost metagenome]
MVERKVQGKTVLIYSTPKGGALEEEIRSASKRLFKRYEKVVGTEIARQLSRDLEAASEQLERK